MSYKVDKRETIKALNDKFRCKGEGTGSLMITRGIIDLGGRAVHDIVSSVRSFDNFSTDNDPWGEHDCGSFTYGGETIFWKIDYYDRSMKNGSPNAADPDVTHRVLTVMVSSEY